MCVCSLLSTWLSRFFMQKLSMKQGDAGVHCGQHPTKTPQCSCDMKKGRFLHVPVFDNGKRLSQEPHTCSREATRFYEKFFDVSRSFGVSSSSLKFREGSVFREVMKMRLRNLTWGLQDAECLLLLYQLEKDKCHQCVCVCLVLVRRQNVAANLDTAFLSWWGCLVLHLICDTRKMSYAVQHPCRGANDVKHVLET